MNKFSQMTARTIGPGGYGVRVVPAFGVEEVD
jgi:hypothetical protein